MYVYCAFRALVKDLFILKLGNCQIILGLLVRFCIVFDPGVDMTYVNSAASKRRIESFR